MTGIIVEVRKASEDNLSDGMALERAATANAIGRPPLGIGTLDLDAATLGVLRLRKRGTATAATINRLLLDLIGSDALRREVGAAMGA